MLKLATIPAPLTQLPTRGRSVVLHQAQLLLPPSPMRQPMIIAPLSPLAATTNPPAINANLMIQPAGVHAAATLLVQRVTAT